MPFLLGLLSVFFVIYCELSLLVWVGTNLGILWLILLLIGSFMLGIMMIKARGWYTLLNVKAEISQGQIPTQSLLKSGIWIAAGILFLIPGFLTDILGLFILLPFVSKIIEKFLVKKVKVVSSNFSFQSQRTFYDHQQSDIFEAEFERKADDDKRLK